MPPYVDGSSDLSPSTDRKLSGGALGATPVAGERGYGRITRKALSRVSARITEFAGISVLIGLLPALGAGVSLASRRAGRLVGIPAGLAEIAFLIAIALIAHVTSWVPGKSHARGAHSTVVVWELHVPLDQLHRLGEPPAAGLLALRVADPMHVRLAGERRERVVVGARPRVSLQGGFE